MAGIARQLAAIMYTDVVGYTGMMQSDEPGTIDRLENYRFFLEEAIKEFEGRVIQYYGDGSLVLFNSAYLAVLCAIKIQAQSKPSEIPLRIGIHLGEIIFKDGSLYGDGLNIAARLESLGVRGSILISGTLFEQIHNQPDLTISFLGRYRVKNVKSPLSVYSVSNEGLPVPGRKNLNNALNEDLKTGISKKKNNNLWLSGLILSILLFLITGVLIMRKSSRVREYNTIAVLPFINLTNDTSQEFFCEGITEDIQTQLVKIGNLKVIPGSLTLESQNSDKTIPQIGNELKASKILQGSVRKSENKIRVFAELLDAKQGVQLWSQSYDYDNSKALKIQTEVASKIVLALKNELSRRNKSIILRKNPPASGLSASGLNRLKSFTGINKTAGTRLAVNLSF